MTAALVLAVALTALVVACGDDDGDGADLAGSSWVLSALAGTMPSRARR